MDLIVVGLIVLLLVPAISFLFAWQVARVHVFARKRFVKWSLITLGAYYASAAMLMTAIWIIDVQTGVEPSGLQMLNCGVILAGPAIALLLYEKARTFVRGSSDRCRYCGYILGATHQSRCPECGNQIGRSDDRDHPP